MVKPSRRATLLLALVLWPSAHLSAQPVTIDVVGDAMKIRASSFDFLKGDLLTRLKDGRTVRLELAALALPAQGKEPAAATRRIFSVSYDLWEERFAVTAVGPRPQSVSHLLLPAAEAWCVDQLSIPLNALGALGRDLPFWIRLEYRLVDSEGTSDPADSGYSLQTLIDVLSRRRKTDSTVHPLEAGPFRLPTRSSR